MSEKQKRQGKSAAAAAVIERAARAVIAGSDYEAEFYEGQSAVEDWALVALERAVNGDLAGAVRLLDRYESAPWNHEECEEPVCLVCCEDEGGDEHDPRLRTVGLGHEYQPDAPEHDAADPLHRANWADPEEPGLSDFSNKKGA